MRYRVVQWATGGVGRAAIEAVLAHPELELVGCWVHSAVKAGRDVGELIGRAPLGVLATDDVEAIYALEADCVVYAPLLPDKEHLSRLLRSGKNVVTPVGWFHPDGSGGGLDAVAREAGRTLHGTGIDPGGITDLLPLVLSALSSSVTFVRAEEFSDVRTYGAPDVLRHIMRFGVPPEQALGGPMLAMLGAGFTQSLQMILDELDFHPGTRIRAQQQVAVATAPIDSPIGIIEPGLVAGQRFQWEAVLGDEVVARVAVNWLMGERHLDPPWTLGAGGERFEIQIEGDPGMAVTITGLQPTSVAEGLARNPGIVATANHCVNSVPYVCAAAPGWRGYLDLPVMAGRAHPRLARLGR